MFIDSIKRDSIPIRVFELYRIIKSNRNLKDNDIKVMMEPSELSYGQSSTYNQVKDAAIELNLIDKELNIVSDFNIDTMDDFRRYCNSILFKNQNGIFYKLTKCILSSNDEWLKYPNLTDSKALDYVREYSGIGKADPEMLQGARFWMSFLGFVYISEAKKIFILPNMYVALKDFISFSEFKKENDYTLSEFVDKIKPFGSVALGGSERRTLNLAMSNALRQMHDNNEIILKRNLDSEEVWRLFENKQHMIPDEVTHIYFC